MPDTNLSENSPVSITIGATTYTSVVSVALRFQRAGGGEMVTSRTVANSHVPIGVTDHPKECVLVVVLDADVVPALMTSNYLNMSGANAAPSALVITEKNTAGATRTVTFTAANCKIQNVAPKNVVEGEQHVEITFLTYGSITYSAFA
jgi:hypothetical protein